MYEVKNHAIILGIFSLLASSLLFSPTATFAADVCIPSSSLIFNGSYISRRGTGTIAVSIPKDRPRSELYELCDRQTGAFGLAKYRASTRYSSAMQDVRNGYYGYLCEDIYRGSISKLYYGYNPNNSTDACYLNSLEDRGDYYIVHCKCSVKVSADWACCERP